MMLDERKMLILTEIVDYYISSAEPIGSRTLSKIPEIGLSSATIRNEMSDLEDLGFLTKTHISSGRIPSNKAYREYVNHFFNDGLKVNKKYVASLKESLDYGGESLKNYYEAAIKLLVEKTNYLSLIVSPISNTSIVEFVKVEALGSNRILFVLVGKSGHTASYILDNRGIDVETSIDDLEDFIKRLVLKKDIEEIKTIIKTLDSDLVNRDFYLKVLKKTLDFLEEEASYNIYLNGIGNVINYYEEEDHVKSLIDYLEDEANIINMFLNNEGKDVLNIKIGAENDEDILKESSLIYSNYDNGLGQRGNIILIGPTRMDYLKIANIIFNFSKALSNNE
ncbi:heat-inducible transcriptional repressor HrcA [Neofamilia massiliensis]|uniref:heat-inducible transcriptional repressor HrcA n=1 Tax=Neofamilia massiliensis TaxID=1673724 RepID=UPI0009EC884B|nr:heat-inducible transcriptional repressor HrcA [Neofamilia massiliensis]